MYKGSSREKEKPDRHTVFMGEDKLVSSSDWLHQGKYRLFLAILSAINKMVAVSSASVVPLPKHTNHT